MKLNPEQLEEITEFGKLQFLPNEIALIMQIDSKQFYEEIVSSKGEIWMAYIRGQLIAEAEVRKAILTMATQGSSPAQKEFLNLVKQRKGKKYVPDTI